jgi:hypothetical protein
VYAFSPRDDRVPIAIEITDQQDKTIKSLGLQIFTAKKEGEATHMETLDRSQPLLVKITESEGKIHNIGFRIDDTKGDSVKLLDAMDFITALDPSRRLKVYNAKLGDYQESPISARPEEFDQLRYDFIRSLAIIQKHTNEPMHLPDTVPTRESVMEVFSAADIIQKGKVEVSTSFTVSVLRSSAIKIVDDYINDKIGKDTAVSFPIHLMTKVLDKEVIVKSLVDLSKLKPKGNLEELRKRLEDQNEDIAQIELEPVV